MIGSKILGENSQQMFCYIEQCITIIKVLREIFPLGSVALLADWQP